MENKDTQLPIVIKEQYGKGRLNTGKEILCECGKVVPYHFSVCRCEQDAKRGEMMNGKEE